MTMINEPHDDVFKEIRDRLARVSGLDYNFRQRLANAKKISLTITADKISFDIETDDRREGFDDSAKAG